MKLSAHYSRASIIITVIVLLTGAVIYYYAINYIAHNQLDRDLTEEIDEVNDYVKLNHQLPKQVDFDEDVTVFIKVKQTHLPRTFFDTIYRNPKEKEIEPGRAVSGLVSVNSKNYRVTITVSRESTEYLIQIISIITLVLTISLLAILLLTNRYILNGLWKPFFDTLNQLKALNLADNKNLALKQNNVDEFRELNEVVYSMSSRIKNDYQHLKHFTENASHEMMTPLAVITSKLDTLIQDETLKAEHLEQISGIYAATGKLSRLNQTLLLLVKIENNLITDTEALSLDALIIQKNRQFQELIHAKDLIVKLSLTLKDVKASRFLVDILLNNLFSNAVRHNVDFGNIEINLTDNKLIFKNSGPTRVLNENMLFERFQKSQKSEGAGLGLTIVKNICTLYKWDITYYFENSMHAFQITF
jgi:signal transduction histidine kinase